MAERTNSALLRSERIPIGFLDDLSRSNSQADVFSAYARWSTRIFKADRTTIAIADDHRGILHLTAIDGNQAIATGSEIPIEGSLIGRVYSTQTAEICPDLRLSTDLEAPKLLSGGLISVMDVPLSAGNRQFGAVAQGFCTLPPPTPDDLLVLSAIARCLASHLLLQEQVVQLSELALTDPLTKAFNRRVFEDRMGDLWEDWQEDRQPFSVAIVDLDHFKRINDDHGHDFGDYVLKCVADTLRQASRPDDTVIRMGGEEFCVVLENTDLTTALPVAARLREAIEDLQLSAGDTPVRITASIGVAATQDGAESARLVSLMADRALYRAKQAGRNRVMQAA